jgi:hypothetical protein
MFPLDLKFDVANSTLRLRHRADAMRSTSSTIFSTP